MAGQSKAIMNVIPTKVKKAERFAIDFEASPAWAIVFVSKVAFV